MRATPVRSWVRLPYAQALSYEESSRKLVAQARARFAETDPVLRGRPSWDALYKRFREWADLTEGRASDYFTEETWDRVLQVEAQFEKGRLDELARATPRPTEAADVWGWRGWGAVGALLAAGALLSRRDER
jgi:hypothetical protein